MTRLQPRHKLPQFWELASRNENKPTLELKINSCCSVTQLCPTLCNPMDCSMLGFPVLHHLLEFAQTPLSWWCHPTISASEDLCLQSFQASGSIPKSQLFTSGDKSTGASASVLPLNIHGWFLLGLTGLVSLLAKGFQESSPAPQFESINSLLFYLLYSPALTTICHHREDHSRDYKEHGRVTSLLFNTLLRFA